MILVDTSVWIDHFRRSDDALVGLLSANAVLMHSHVLGEIALSSLARRNTVLALLKGLPSAPQAGDEEVMELIEVRRLAGSGIGFTDAHLLASILLAPGARLWSRDRNLAAAATKLKVAFVPA